MDINFACPNCNQLLTADDAMIGEEIQCPSCNLTFNVPEGSPAPVAAVLDDPVEALYAPPSGTNPPRQRVSLSLPSAGSADPGLIQKANKSLEVAAKDAVNFVVRTIRHHECVVQGRDRFEDMVAEVLSGIGEGHLHSITPIQYSRVDAASQLPLTDYGVMIIYKKV